MLPWWLRLALLAGGTFAAAIFLLNNVLAVVVLAVLAWVAVIIGFLFRAGAIALAAPLRWAAEIITRPSTTSTPAAPSVSGPAPAKSVSSPAQAQRDPQVVYAEAVNDMKSLLGQESAKRQLQSYVSAVQAQVQRGKKGLDEALVSLLIIEGPSGVGKTGFAETVSKLMYGCGALWSEGIVRLQRKHVVDAGPGGASKVVEAAATAAVGGVLLIEGAEWMTLAEPDASLRFAEEVGRALVHVAADNPGDLLVVMTGRPGLRRHLEHTDLKRAWINKADVNFVELGSLSDEDLVTVFERQAQGSKTQIRADVREVLRRALAGRSKDIDFAGGDTVRQIFSRAERSALLRAPRGSSPVIEPDDIRQAMDDQ